MFLNAYIFGALDINKNGSFTMYDCDTYTYNSLSPHPLNDMEPEVTVYLRTAALLHMMIGRKYSPTVFKTHSTNGQVGGIDLIPKPLTKKAVYLVRDPRDVLVSFARHTGKKADYVITSMNDMQNMIRSDNVGIGTWLTSWSAHVDSWDKDFVTRIKFEDLKKHPKREFTKILQTFGINADKKRVKKAIKLCNLERLKKQEEKDGFVEKGRQDKFFGQGKGWREELTKVQIRRIEEDHGKVMEKCGYELSGS